MTDTHLHQDDTVWQVFDGTIEPLHPELAARLEDVGSFQVIRHPLVFSVPYFGEVVNAQLNRQLAAKQHLLQHAYATNDWSQVIQLYERPYRFEAFQAIQTKLKDLEYWKLLAQVWTDTENAWQNLEDWRHAFASPRPDRHGLMSRVEWRKLTQLPELVTIYRGIQDRTRATGLSWTLNLKTAQWFASRFSSGGMVLQGRVKKTDILAYLTTRDEDEILVFHEAVQDVTPVVKTTKVKKRQIQSR